MEEVGAESVLQEMALPLPDIQATEGEEVEGEGEVAVFSRANHLLSLGIQEVDPPSLPTGDGDGERYWFCGSVSSLLEREILGVPRSVKDSTNDTMKLRVV
jgi:hypothetical protein